MSDIYKPQRLINEHRLDGRWANTVASWGGSIPVAMWRMSHEGIYPPAPWPDAFSDVRDEATQLLRLLRNMEVRI